jgi:hypothetical protein
MRLGFGISLTRGAFVGGLDARVTIQPQDIINPDAP